MIKLCKDCKVELNEANAAKKNAKYFRNQCKPCRSKMVCKYQKNNRAKRNKYNNEYKRRIGKVKQYPCLVCGKLCYKVYAHSFCSVECRFMFYVKKEESCWVWIGTKDRAGYGKFMMDNKHMRAHRVSYLLFKGPIVDNKLVCHMCDNPPCVKISHLWLGTNSENQIDSVKKGRRKKLTKEIKNASK